MSPIRFSSNLPKAAEDPVEDGRVYPADEVARHAVRVLEIHGQTGGVHWAADALTK